MARARGFFLTKLDISDFGLEQYFSQLLSGKKYLGYVELIRPWNGVVTGFLAVLGTLFAVPSYGDILRLEILFFAFMFAYNAGTILNDIFDERIDRINMPYRPMQSGKVSEQDAIKFSAILHLSALVLVVWLDWRVTPVILGFFLFSWFYSVPPVRFVSRGFLAQLNLAFVAGFIPLYGGAAFALRSLWIPLKLIDAFAIFSILFSFMFLVKDYKDIAGDKVGGKHTVVLSIGKVATKWLMMSGTAIFYPLTIYLFYELTKSTGIVLVGLLLLALTLFYQLRTVEKPGTVFASNRLFMVIFVVATALALKSVF